VGRTGSLSVSAPRRRQIARAILPSSSDRVCRCAPSPASSEGAPAVRALALGDGAYVRPLYRSGHHVIGDDDRA